MTKCRYLTSRHQRHLESVSTIGSLNQLRSPDVLPTRLSFCVLSFTLPVWKLRVRDGGDRNEVRLDEVTHREVSRRWSRFLSFKLQGSSRLQLAPSIPDGYWELLTLLGQRVSLTWRVTRPRPLNRWFFQNVEYLNGGDPGA